MTINNFQIDFCALTMFLCVLTVTFKILCDINNGSLSPPQWLFVLLHWCDVSSKWLLDVHKDFTWPKRLCRTFSVFVCSYNDSLCPPKTLCDLLQWWLTTFTMTLIFTVTSPLHSDPLWSFYWLSDLHTKIYLSLYSSTNNCCPQTDWDLQFLSVAIKMPVCSQNDFVSPLLWLFVNLTKMLHAIHSDF